jgi:hypothetical protein
MYTLWSFYTLLYFVEFIAIAKAGSVGNRKMFLLIHKFGKLIRQYILVYELLAHLGILISSHKMHIKRFVHLINYVSVFLFSQMQNTLIYS